MSDSLLAPRNFLSGFRTRCITTRKPLGIDEWNFICDHMKSRDMARYIHGGRIRTLAEIDTVRLDDVRLIYLDGQIQVFYFP